LGFLLSGESSFWEYYLLMYKAKRRLLNKEKINHG